MAQGNKSRIVIWTIVGIIVVAALVWFVFLNRKPAEGAGEFDRDKAERFQRTMGGRIDRRERDAAEARALYGPDADDLFAEVEANIAASRSWLERITELETARDMEAAKESTWAYYRSAGAILKDLE